MFPGWAFPFPMMASNGNEKRRESFRESVAGMASGNGKGKGRGIIYSKVCFELAGVRSGHGRSDP